MKLYKFRPLGKDKDFDRAVNIIKNNKFHCSKLWDLNDPMEGVYKNSNFTTQQSKDLLTEKNEYLICSFSGKTGLNNPILWGYYANGFKGIAIEVEVEENHNIREMEYLSPSEFFKNLDNVKKIITRKLINWCHENEYRFLKRISNNKQHIGQVTKIIFGNPYGNIHNRDEVIKLSNCLKQYLDFKEKLENICKYQNIKYENYKYL